MDLTREQVEGALQSRAHPIIGVLGAQKLRVDGFNRVYRTLGTPEEQQDYIRRELGFLGIEFENLRGGYQLGPLDMVSVWAHTMDPNGLNLDRYQRRALAKLAACAYGIRGLEQWKGSSKYLHEQGDFPRIETATPEDLKRLRGRLDEIKASKDDISAYLTGGYRGNPFNLASSAGRGDQEAISRLEEVKKTKTKKTKPPLPQPS